MAQYATPELLLVGAAQNLVLGASSFKSERCNLELEDPPGYQDEPAW